MSDSLTPPRRVPRAWALALLWAVLLLAAAQAVMLGWSYVAAVHGPGIVVPPIPDIPTAPGLAVKGVPLWLWLVPVYSVMAWLAVPGLRADERGRRARGGLLVVALLPVLTSIVAAVAVLHNGGTFNSAELSLDLLHVVALGLILVPGPRRPRRPMGVDMIGVLFIGITTVGITVQAALIASAHLDRAVAAKRGPT